jgi:hypothetical protein
MGEKPEFKREYCGEKCYSCGQCFRENIKDASSNGYGHRMSYCPDCGIRIDWVDVNKAARYE